MYSRTEAFDEWRRHARLYGMFAQTCLLREIAFRANFLVRLITHVIWLGMMLAFLIGYFTLLACGVAILYSLVVVLAAPSVWTVRHEELYELWFYLLQFGNYPDEVYRGHIVGTGVRIVLTYALPILLAVNVPARYGATLLDDWRPVASLVAAAIASLAASRAFFKFALRSYQGAGS